VLKHIKETNMLLLALFACKDKVTASGELGRINYALTSSYSLDTVDLNETQLVTGYPQNFTASLTLQGWKMVENDSILIYHSSPDDVTLDSETLLDGVIGVPGFSIQSDSEGNFLVESYLQGELIDQIHIDFVVPDEISVISWVRGPDTEEFTKESGENISVSLGSQAAFVPVPKANGKRIVGDVEVELSVDPPSAAVVGYNIGSVSEDGVDSSASPPSIYFVETGTVAIGATDIYNDVTTWQNFTVE
jgi:hypothetical protein